MRNLFDNENIVLGGKLVATATSICGIIVLAFPISMIVEKFANAQQKAMEEEQMHQGYFLPNFRKLLSSTNVRSGE